MPAVGEQVLAAGNQRLVDVEARHGARAPLCVIIVAREHNRRDVIFFRQSPRNDANNAKVPSGSADDERESFAALQEVIRLPDALLQNGAFDLAALRVQFVQLDREAPCFRRVFRRQQMKGQCGIVRASRRVEPRPKAKADQFGRGGLLLVARNLQQRAQSRPARVQDRIKAVAHEDAVLARERHHVGHRAQRHQVQLCEQKLLRLILAEGAFLQQRVCELEGHANAAQSRRFVDTIDAVGIHQRHRRRQFTRRQMMIRHDDVDVQFVRAADFRDGTDARINGDDQVAAFCGDLFHPRQVHAIAVIDAMGNDDLRIAAQQPQHANHQRRRRHAIHVVIAIHANALSVQKRLVGAIHRRIHVAQFKGTAQLLQHRSQKTFRIQAVRHPTACRQQSRNHRMQAKLLRNVSRHVILCRRHLPAIGANGIIGGARRMHKARVHASAPRESTKHTRCRRGGCSVRGKCVSLFDFPPGEFGQSLPHGSCKNSHHNCLRRRDRSRNHEGHAGDTRRRGRCA